jgi:hypothetical protein
VVLFNKSVMGAELPELRAVPPVIPPVTVGAGQVKVVPATSGVVVMVREAVAPLQSDWVNPVVTDGVAFTVTVRVDGVPAHVIGPGPVGVRI